MAAVLPGISRLSRSLQSGAGGLRWPDQCCLLLSAQSVSAVEKHTCGKPTGCQAAFKHPDTILYLEICAVQSAPSAGLVCSTDCFEHNGSKFPDVDCSLNVYIHSSWT